MSEDRFAPDALPPAELISGESIYLRLPDIERDIIHGSWHTWFNDPDITEYLTHGVYPIDRKEQADLIKEEMAKNNSLILCVIQREQNKHIGVISLKNIDLINKTAEIGIVMGPNRSPVAAFEAMSILMRHAFDRLNLSLLYAGQHEGLWKWVSALSLIGFRIDGFRRHVGFRNGKSYGVFLTSVSAEDFYGLLRSRNGQILTEHPISLLKDRNNISPVEEIDGMINDFNCRWRGF